MKILVLADVPCKSLWDFYEEGKLDSYDLILSAGDLPAEYLSFLVTFAHCPVFYVHGNHDDRYESKPPEGCECIDGRIVRYQGLRILGLGGSMRYKAGVNQYTEAQMSKRILRLQLTLLRNHGFDLLLTHAPLRGVNDGADLCHTGFVCFEKLLNKYEPSYMIHGHIHMNYAPLLPRETSFGKTKIINAYEKYEILI